MKSPSAGKDIFRAVADPTRRAVLDLLLESERTVNEIVGRFRMTQPALSQHLRVLRQAGLITPRQAGRQRIYQVRADRLKPVAEWVARYERFWKKKLLALGAFLEKEP